MKTLKRSMIYMVCCLIAGLLLIAAAAVRRDLPTEVWSIGFALSVVAALNLIRRARLLRNPEKVRQYELMQHEERIVYLANRARSLTFAITIGVQYIAMLAFLLHGDVQIAAVLCYVTGAQMLCYCLCYFILGRRC